MAADGVSGPAEGILSDRKITLVYGITEEPNHPNQIPEDPLDPLPIVDTPHATIRSRIVGFCCGRELAVTAREKRLQVVKVLSVTLLPILGLWVFTAYSLNDSIEVKMDIEQDGVSAHWQAVRAKPHRSGPSQKGDSRLMPKAYARSLCAGEVLKCLQTQSAVKFSVEIGIFLDRIQRERDMSVLYLSILGPETRAFLLNEYILTNEALQGLSGWPVSNDFNTVFRSKQSFQNYLDDHRNKLDPNDFNIYSTMEFYNGLIERFVEWLYGSIKESSMASIWKVLVAYQKIVTGMEHIGIERALGTVFFVEGGLPQSWYERYNYRVNIFNANYRSAVFYSDIVDPMYQQQMWTDVDIVPVMDVIGSFRFTIQHSVAVEASIIKGQWWFDNMTVYLDRLLVIQQKLATFINGELQTIIDEEEKNLTISACFLAFVIFMCPLVIYSVEALTSDIQIYAIAMANKTQELVTEKEKIDTLLYQMVPKLVANRLRLGNTTEGEYFKSITVLFFDIDAFIYIVEQYSPTEIVSFLNCLNVEVDKVIDKFNVYKVETLQNSYMVASGLPVRNGDRHSAAIAGLALSLVELMTKNVFTVGQHRISLRMGMDTGSCLAGVLAMTLPRYCLFGDIISTAAQMKSYSLPNKIHLSNHTAKCLKKHGVFVMKFRGHFPIKGKGKRKTFWLEGVKDKDTRIFEKQMSYDSASSDLFHQQVAGEMVADSREVDQVRSHKHYTQDVRKTTQESLDMGCSLNDITDDPVDNHGHWRGFKAQPKTPNTSSTSQEDPQNKVPGTRKGFSRTSMTSMSAIKEAWQTDTEPKKNRDKKKERPKMRKSDSLASISEFLSQKAVSLGSGGKPGDRVSATTETQTSSISNTQTAGKRTAVRALSSGDLQSGASTKPSVGEERRTSVFSRSSSLESQIGASHKTSVGRKASWPESSTEDKGRVSPKTQKPQYPMHSHASLPGAGDVKARLEWELQQSSWFLQFSKPSVRMKYTAAATSSCRSTREAGEECGQEHVATPTNPSEHKINYSSIEMSSDKADSSAVPRSHLHATSLTGSPSNPTPANSPCHSITSHSNISPPQLRKAVEDTTEDDY